MEHIMCLWYVYKFLTIACYWTNISIRPFPDISDVGSAFTLSGGKETCKTCSVESTGLQSNVFKIRTILYKLFFQLMHVTDWLPTLITAAGGNGSELANNLDGIDQWFSISTNQSSTRTQLIVNIDEVMKNAAIRDRDWKLVIGEPLAKFQISI